ncbi:hypothetical protein CDD81_4836 [Ophiocordyceps australis]|uniref:AMP-dependent synthetase/ligase domain-containing protein n=1 Tax=Ophiocordyceps australis TaxID=1399860 RepID=A0A2C5YAD7_9HYPO|nr:hypothetical protein CDD81_4836 [Ophiocordyceps australis]
MATGMQTRGKQYAQEQVLRDSLDNAGEFWARQAQRISWHKQPETVQQAVSKKLESGDEYTDWTWFPDGELSLCYNCVDRHVARGNGDEVALYYDSPVLGVKERYTYSQLGSEVEVLAGALRELGVGKGDVVVFYMPTIPATMIGLLAVNRLGAIHCVVFGGFAPTALAQRIEAVQPVALLTCSCGINGNEAPIAYQPLVQEALAQSRHAPRMVLVWQRAESKWETSSGPQAAIWQDVVASARERKIRAGCVAVKSSHASNILHTSGTTSKPKGVVRDTGGYAVGLQLSMQSMMDIHGPGDVVFTASDIGWIVGHSYLLYGPLLVGAASVLFEGKPVGTPDASAFWRLVDEYKVKAMFTAPAALRAIRYVDPDNEHLEQVGRGNGLRSLKTLFLAGEKSEPALVTAYQDLLTRHGALGAQVVDNWWLTEVGSPITGRAQCPAAAMACHSEFATTAMDDDKTRHSSLVLPLVPGSAGKAMPGFDVRILDDQGKEAKPGVQGNIALRLPLAPTCFHTLWEDEQRFYRGYLKRFGGNLLDTGDVGHLDAQGNLHVSGRADDLLNVSAHRLSNGESQVSLCPLPWEPSCSALGVVLVSPGRASLLG